MVLFTLACPFRSPWFSLPCTPTDSPPQDALILVILTPNPHHPGARSAPRLNTTNPWAGAPPSLGSAPLCRSSLSHLASQHQPSGPSATGAARYLAFLTAVVSSRAPCQGLGFPPLFSWEGSPCAVKPWHLPPPAPPLGHVLCMHHVVPRDHGHPQPCVPPTSTTSGTCVLVVATWVKNPVICSSAQENRAL